MFAKVLIILAFLLLGFLVIATAVAVGCIFASVAGSKPEELLEDNN